MTVSDAAFAAALDRLSLGAWPLPAEGRSSALWTEVGGGWGLVGVLLESPEPMHRPGRFEIGTLTLDTTTFPIAVRDASGCRSLFLARAPLAPTPAGTLRLAYTDRGAARTASGSVATLPAFARELA